MTKDKGQKTKLPLRKMALVLLGGICMGLTPAPVEAFPLAWVALIPLWYLCVRATPRKAALYALIWGAGYHGLGLFWILGIHPMTWLGVPWLASLAIALFCWCFITLWGALLVVVWATAIALIEEKKAVSPLIRVLIGVALWCGLEAVWSAGPLWWTSLAFAQSPHNLFVLQLSQLSGPATVTAAIVAVNGLMGEWLIARQRGAIQGKILPILALGLLASCHAIGGFLYTRPLTNTNPIQVGIIQGNIPNDIKLFSEGRRRAMERYTQGYTILSDRGVDAVLTPEGALPIFLSQLKQTPFYTAVSNKGVLVWLGAYGEIPTNTSRLSYTNSLFSITGSGSVVSQFDKVKLVPLGEYIPFEPILGKIVDRLSPLEAHMVAGNPAQTFATPLGKAIVGLCYESAFSEHFRRQTAKGGEFILTASNNAHYAQTMPAQHHAQDVLRAIESDRWAARATNTGYSGIVDPRGRTIWRSGINTYEIHADTIYRRQTQTPYVRWGDWLTWTLLGLSAILFFKTTPIPKNPKVTSVG